MLNAESSSALKGATDPAVVVTRGVRTPKEASISVVVMAIDSDRRAVAAVTSLREQEESVEIIVVNTGRGSLKPLLSSQMDDLVLVESSEARLPGGTRNLGIAHSTAEIVAFLAADCLATPSWASRRLAAHIQGPLAVASALRPAPVASGAVPMASWATYALLHSRRAPETPADEAACYGASYHRSLFDRYGLFVEHLRIGEDTEFNARLASDAAVAWNPDVVTLHHYPKTLREAVGDAFDRGFNLYGWQYAHRSRPLNASVRRAMGNWRCAVKFTQRTGGEERQALRRAAPGIALLAISYALGALIASLSRAAAPLREASPKQ